MATITPQHLLFAIASAGVTGPCAGLLWLAAPRLVEPYAVMSAVALIVGETVVTITHRRADPPEDEPELADQLGPDGCESCRRRPAVLTVILDGRPFRVCAPCAPGPAGPSEVPPVLTVVS